MAYGRDLPEWGPELEEQLPEQLQEPPELSEEEAWRKHRQRQRELAGPAFRSPASPEGGSK
jgi:hypothetical protein